MIEHENLIIKLALEILFFSFPISASVPSLCLHEPKHSSLYLNTTCSDPSYRLLPSFFSLHQVLVTLLVCVAAVRNESERRWSRTDSNNSEFRFCFHYSDAGKQEKIVLPYGKYIEYKSCQINKINVVPITIIFEQR